MKIKIVLLFCLTASSFLFSQEAAIPPVKLRHEQAITVGILQGGGSLLGLDYEKMIGNNIGVQVGAGLVGFGAGINYHFEPDANSSAVSLQFWNQGTAGDKLSQRVLGITYMYRGENGGLTAQIGLGSVVTRGKLMDDYYRDKGIANPPSVILLYSLGWYFN